MADLSELRMSKPKKRPVRDTHLYLPQADFEALASIADQHARSITGQALHYVREGLKRDCRSNLTEVE